MKKLILLLCLCGLIVGIWSTFISGVEPVISTDIALQQMNNTTEGHVATRTYLERIQPAARIWFPWLVCLALSLLFYKRELTELVNDKPAPTKPEGKQA